MTTTSGGPGASAATTTVSAVSELFFDMVLKAPKITDSQQMRQFTSKNISSELDIAADFFEKAHQMVRTPSPNDHHQSIGGSNHHHRGGAHVTNNNNNNNDNHIHTSYQDNLLFLYDELNCSNIDFVMSVMNERSKFTYIIETINVISYVIIIIGICFNILNLIVLLKSKLNESPYTYLTMLAFSDLGAISMVGIEKIRQLVEEHVDANVHGALASLTSYAHLYVAAGINIFLSSSMYITLALTIERFIFVHSPFKVT